MFDTEEYKNRLEQKLFRPYGDGSYLVRPYGKFFSSVYQIDSVTKDRFFRFYKWLRYALFVCLFAFIALHDAHPVLAWTLVGVFSFVSITAPIYLIVRDGTRMPSYQWSTEAKSDCFAGFSREHYGRSIVFSIIGVVLFGVLSYFSIKTEGQFTWLSLFVFLPLASGIYSFIGYRRISKQIATPLLKGNTVVEKKTSKPWRGFVIAPLPMQIIVLFQTAIQGTLSSADIRFSIVSILGAYIGLLVFGVPLYFIFRRYKLNALGYYVAASFIPGALSFIGMLALRATTVSQALLANTFVTIIAVVPTVIIFWFIARPDKT